MGSPYLPLFDPTLEMTEGERHRVGLTTALLLVRRQQWLHRRVEMLTFEDQDVIRRQISLDFTFPTWAPDYLGIPDGERMKVAVPLTLLRKDTLVHVNLSDEGSAAIPLLSGPQVGALAEMALLVTAQLALNAQVPQSIACDIQRLTDDRREHESPERRLCPSETFGRLFSPSLPAADARAVLQRHPIFLPLARNLDSNYIAAVVLDLAAGDRRVVHFAYDEMLSKRHSYRRRIAKELFSGSLSRRVGVMADAAGDAASFHMEAEAPEGVRISSRVTLTETAGGDRPGIEARVERSGSYRRIHIHCKDIQATDRLAVLLRLGPRASTIVRGAALASALTFVAVLYARLQIHAIKRQEVAGAAAVLLVIPTILSVWVARSQEHPATTDLLWPIRVVATAPAILGLLSAGVLVSIGATFWGELTLWVMIALLSVTTWILTTTWRGSIRRQKRRIHLFRNHHDGLSDADA